MKKVITNTGIFTGEEFFTGVAILVSNGLIEGFVYDNDLPTDYQVHDLGGKYLAPAFMDLQIYGGNGFLFSAQPSAEAIAATDNYCRSGGASKFLLTMATNSREVISRGLAAARTYIQEGGRGLLGLHLEGPWINPEKRGAHLLPYIHPPTLEEAKKLVEEAEGVVKMITLAPEVTDEAIIDFLQASHIIVAAGHSNATYRQATRAFEKIKTVTHLFNAMSPFQSREPGVVGAIYDHPSVCSSLVADGIHVDFAAIRISKKILGDRLYLITDAVAATDQEPYRHIFKNDRYVIPDGTLSGSALTMMQAVKNCVQQAGIPLEEALRMATLYPARILGADHQYGRVKKGFKAEFVVFDKELNFSNLLD